MESYRPINKKGLAILRVSSHRQEDGYSHELQEAEVRSYAERIGIELTQVIKIIESAKKTEDRTKYRAAINLALSHQIGNVLFYQQDREARNNSDLELNESYVMAGRFVIHYVRDRRVLHKLSPDSEFLTRDFQGVINKQYSRNLSVKVNDAMKHKAETGHYPSNNPPLGYVVKKDLDENGNPKKRGTTIALDVRDWTRAVVLREFMLRSEGMSIPSIRQTILDEKLLPPQKMKTYSSGAIEFRLKNPFYRGRFMWQGKEYLGKHEMFVPSEVLLAVDNSFGLRGYTISKNADAMFVGWLKCGVAGCGCNVIYDPKKKHLTSGEVRVHKYYHCTNGKKAHGSLRGMSVRESELFSGFELALDDFTISSEFASEVARAVNDEHKQTKAMLARQIDSLGAQLSVIDEKIVGLTEKYVTGHVDQDGYELFRAKLQTEKQEAQHKLQNLWNQDHESATENALSILELATKAKSLWLSRNDVEKRDFLKLVLSNPTWNGLSVGYDLKKPFRMLGEMRENPEWRTLLGLNQQPSDS